MRRLLSESPEHHPFDHEEEHGQQEQVEDHEVDVGEVVERQRGEYGDTHGDIERREQGVETDAGDKFVLDAFARAADEEDTEQDADDDDVVPKAGEVPGRSE